MTIVTTLYQYIFYFRKFKKIDLSTLDVVEKKTLLNHICSVIKGKTNKTE